jgi:TonB family protein
MVNLCYRDVTTVDVHCCPYPIQSTLFAMRRCLLRLTLFPVLLFLCTAVENIQAQSAASTDNPQSSAFLTKLHHPIYPPLARTAAIHGDVALTVRIRQDGSADSIEFVSGHPMLKEAAIESAKQAQFECRGCKEAAAPCSLVYTFQFSDESCCTAPSRPPKVSQSEHHVWITTAPFCLCDPSFTVTRKVRSAKCLYLWRCGVR